MAMKHCKDCKKLVEVAVEIKKEPGAFGNTKDKLEERCLICGKKFPSEKCQPSGWGA
jgi:hypothetical protein